MNGAGDPWISMATSCRNNTGSPAVVVTSHAITAPASRPERRGFPQATSSRSSRSSIRERAELTARATLRTSALMATSVLPGQRALYRLERRQALPGLFMLRQEARRCACARGLARFESHPAERRDGGSRGACRPRTGATRWHSADCAARPSAPAAAPATPCGDISARMSRKELDQGVDMLGAAIPAGVGRSVRGFVLIQPFDHDVEHASPPRVYGAAKNTPDPAPASIIVSMTDQDAVSLTKSLLRFDTVNPPGRERDCAQLRRRDARRNGASRSSTSSTPKAAPASSRAPAAATGRRRSA